MKKLIEYYNNLDTLNLIIFWLIVVVIILLGIFIFLMIFKNKHNKNISYEPTNDEENKIENDIIPLESVSEEEIIQEENNIEEPFENEFLEIITPEIEEEKKFTPEEFVMNENKNEQFPEEINIEEPSIKIPNETKEEEKRQPISDYSIPRKPYERNVLREMSLNQTSPIGIVRKNPETNKEIIQKRDSIEKELEHEKMPEIVIEENTQLEEEKDYLTNKNINIEEETIAEKKEQPKEIIRNNEQKQNIENLNRYNKLEAEKYLESLPDIENKKIELNPKYNIPNNDNEFKDQTYEKENNKEYVKEVSEKLSNAKEIEGITRTEYEIKQEEEAIISYEELMKKKDSIKIIDEEEAVISIEELMERQKNNEEKLYRLTEEEENNDFIKELKNFRNDLE